MFPASQNSELFILVVGLAERVPPLQCGFAIFGMWEVWGRESMLINLYIVVIGAGASRYCLCLFFSPEGLPNL